MDGSDGEVEYEEEGSSEESSTQEEESSSNSEENISITITGDDEEEEEPEVPEEPEVVESEAEESESEEDIHFSVDEVAEAADFVFDFSPVEEDVEDVRPDVWGDFFHDYYSEKQILEFMGLLEGAYEFAQGSISEAEESARSAIEAARDDLEYWGSYRDAAYEELYERTGDYVDEMGTDLQINHWTHSD